MRTTLLIFVLFLGTTLMLHAQQETETLFQNARLTGGFGGPIYSYNNTKNTHGFGVGGGGGLVFNRFFIGLFGMGEVFDTPKVGQQNTGLGYGGLWMGYTVPAHKLVHLYTSVKIAGGAVGTTDFDDDWEFDDDFHDAVFVAIPEAGIELNVARWFRLSGSVGYRFVEGFDGLGTVANQDLNTPVYALTLRFGWFGSGVRKAEK